MLITKKTERWECSLSHCRGKAFFGIPQSSLQPEDPFSIWTVTRIKYHHPLLRTVFPWREHDVKHPSFVPSGITDPAPGGRWGCQDANQRWVQNEVEVTSVVRSFNPDQVAVQWKLLLFWCEVHRPYIPQIAVVMIFFKRKSITWRNAVTQGRKMPSHLKVCLSWLQSYFILK